MIATFYASTIGFATHTGEIRPSGCPDTMGDSPFGYVDPDNCAVVDSSVAPDVLAGPFGFGQMPGGSFLTSAAKAYAPLPVRSVRTRASHSSRV